MVIEEVPEDWKTANVTLQEREEGANYIAVSLSLIPGKLLQILIEIIFIYIEGQEDHWEYSAGEITPDQHNSLL